MRITSQATAFSIAGLLISALAFVGCGDDKPAAPARPDDPGRPLTLSELPEITEDVFSPMDRAGQPAQTPQFLADEIKGRNTWNLWTGGNEQFWDKMARDSYGLSDLLKMLDSRNRSKRFQEMGLINEPGFKQASNPDQYGLWLDDGPEGLPGVEIGKFKRDYEKAYGRSSGVLGFRLFPNPDFNGAAVARWNTVKGKYYDDPSIAADPSVIRPYRVGVSCGACHIAFHPLYPPSDPASPAWENLSSTIGNQYIREGRVFASTVDKGGFLWQMIQTQPAGTSDTSRVATDHINNPNVINAIFRLDWRLRAATPEKLAGESLLLPTAHEEMDVPHVLKDGADSVGVVGATLRVYINIGLYHQHWIQQHNLLIGIRPQEPFSIKAAQDHSVYWKANETKFANIGRFFSKINPMKLADAPGGKDYLKADEPVLALGRKVFAENCAECHSSKRPPSGFKGDRDAWFVTEAAKPSFFEENFLSDDQPHPVPEIGTNSARACGTNAMEGHIWANFSSKTYKERAAVEPITVYNPYTERDEPFTIGGGGRGYYRTPSLIGIWTSAPFLHNNTLGDYGTYDNRASVAARMKMFDDAVRKLLWPEKRLGKESIWRTQEDCQLQIFWKAIPEPWRGMLRAKMKAHDFVMSLLNRGDRFGNDLKEELGSDDTYFRIGFIPKGMPINLLANLNPEADKGDLVDLVVKLKVLLLKAKIENWDSKRLTEELRTDVAPRLWKLSKCPDFVNDRGHDFGSALAPAEKEALIELLKTF